MWECLGKGVQLLGGQVNPQEAMQRSWRDETHSGTQRSLKQGERWQQYCGASMDGTERRREMGGMKVRSYERGRQAWTWAYVRGVHGMTRLSERNEVLA